MHSTTARLDSIGRGHMTKSIADVEMESHRTFACVLRFVPSHPFRRGGTTSKSHGDTRRVWQQTWFVVARVR